jgi:hypothetical protein
MIYSRHYHIHLTSELSKLHMLLWKPFIVPELFWSSLYGLVLLWVYELVCYLWFIPLIARHVIHQFASCSSWLKTLQDCCTVVCWCVLALLFLVILIPPKTYCILQEFLCASKATCNQTRTLGPSDTERKFEPWVLRQYRGLLSNWLWVIEAKAKVIIIPVFKAQSLHYEVIIVNLL